MDLTSDPPNGEEEKKESQCQAPKIKASVSTEPRRGSKHLFTYFSVSENPSFNKQLS